jgi:hypothetical protein
LHSFPSIDNVSVEMAPHFATQPVVRPRTTVEARIPVSTSSRHPYFLVPPIATNFGPQFSTTSPISLQSSKSGTPRGTPTSTKLPTIRNSILDEVEGSLTATIKEFQSLQGSWHHDSPPHTPEQMFDSSLYQIPNQLFLQRRGSSTSIGHSATWDPSQMGGPLYQYPPLNSGHLSQPQSPTRHTPCSSGTFLGVQEYGTKLVDMQRAYEEQRKASHAIQLESGQVRKQLEFLKDRIVEFESEKHSLQQTVRDAEEKLHMTLTKLREAKVSELAAQKEFTASRYTISSLENRQQADKKKLRLMQEDLEAERETVAKTNAKLEEANTHKVDLLERELDNRREIIVTKKKLKKAIDELNVYKRRARDTPINTPNSPYEDRSLLQDTQLQLAEARRVNAALVAQLNLISPASDLPTHIAHMAFQIDPMQPELFTIRKRPSSPAISPTTLTHPSPNFFSSTPAPSSPEQTRATTSSSSASEPFDELAILRASLAASERARRDAVVERDRLGQLLRAELRRIAVDDHSGRHPSETLVRGRTELRSAVEIVRERAKGWVEEMKGADNEETERLRGEIEYYLNDIVLYKMDVKGYKKDLRKAEKRIRELTDVGQRDMIMLETNRL